MINKYTYNQGKLTNKTPTNEKYIEKKEGEQISHGSSTPIEEDLTPDRQDASSMCYF